ncbi:acyltransferase [Streptomyces sp. ISL-86]|uniref:acyltransferase family protein n=1 Tax=Streptomyces sp. ISL-86 TaxID=2819187 RepID=UPI001BE5FCF6|nr:acyltransferase [Streptomyces sp. ISL-86]MBT2453636.1 acyltransferase family protein [Streptomyces sp. ISL-86]
MTHPAVPAPRPATASAPDPATAPATTSGSTPGSGPGCTPGSAAGSVPRSAPRPGSGRGGRLYTLDGLRLIAALMVVAFHFIAFDDWGTPVWGVSTSEVFPTAHPFASYGWLGVQLFFLISGFVICMSCWGRDVRQFAVSRVIRLYPAYWFAVLVTAAVMLVSHGPKQTGITASKILTNLTMLQEAIGVGDIDPAYWTLWAELRFYLLFAVVAALGLTYRRVVVFCGLWLLLSVLGPHADNELIDLFAMPGAAPFFVAGVVMFLMYRFGPTPVTWLLLGTSWLLAQNQLRFLMKTAEGSVRHSISWPVCLAVITVFYLLVLAVALGRLSFFNRRWLTTAGALTFPLYLLHEQLGWEVFRRLHTSVAPGVLVGGVVAAMLVAAWLVHRFVERPSAKALKKWLAPAAGG